MTVLLKKAVRGACYYWQGRAGSVTDCFSGSSRPPRLVSRVFFRDRMDAPSALPGSAPAKVNKSKAWMVYVGLVVLLVVVFMFLRASFNIEYELAVRRKMPNWDGAKFSDIKRYPSGVVCGTVNSKAGVQRFVAPKQGDVVLENSKGTTTEAYVAASKLSCHD
jgi:hypothetical protein